jgi:hypothetical protein
MGEAEERDPFAARDAARAMMRQTLQVSASPRRDQAGQDKPKRFAAMVMALAIAAICAGAGIVWVLAGHPAAIVQPGPPPSFLPAPQPAPPAWVVQSAADEAALLAAPTDRLRIYRLAAAPSILVLLFPSLHAQALALNRVGAFVEKRDAPRDRVLDDAELRAKAEATPGGFDGYYYGHDYRVADLARFFAVAAGQGVALRPEERALQAGLTDLPVPPEGGVGAIVTLPPLSASPAIGATDRAAILRHELAHGVYFTDAAYAAYVQRFWQQSMSAAERAGFRRFLGTEGYDVANEDLVCNEMQAYLIHTPDPRYFSPGLAGLAPARAAALRADFVASMPASWLRDVTARR